MREIHHGLKMCDDIIVTYNEEEDVGVHAEYVGCIDAVLWGVAQTFFAGVSSVPYARPASGTSQKYLNRMADIFGGESRLIPKFLKRKAGNSMVRRLKDLPEEGFDNKMYRAYLGSDELGQKVRKELEDQGRVPKYFHLYDHVEMEEYQKQHQTDWWRRISNP